MSTEKPSPLRGSPTTGSGLSSDELTRLATLYYVDGETQEALAQRFGLSRATVGRMLRRAQDVGIVEIRVRHHPSHTVDVERELIKRFCITRALLSVDHANPDLQRGLFAALVANDLERNLPEGAIVAIGWPPALTAKAEAGTRPR